MSLLKRTPTVMPSASAPVSATAVICGEIGSSKSWQGQLASGGDVTVNADVASWASALPARSVTPDEPPRTLTVYCAVYASCLAGVTVARRVVGSYAMLAAT